MATEVEEVIVTANARESKQIRPNPGQTLFGLPDRRLVASARGCAHVRRRERLAIELAVRGQRQRLERKIGRGNHIFRQSRGKMRAQRLGSRRRCTRPCRGVSHEPLVAWRVLLRKNNRLTYPRMLGESSLDLAELDPEAPDLHLEIVAAKKLDRPVRPIAAKVPRTIQPLPVNKRARDEPLRRQIRPVQIAARDPGPPIWISPEAPIGTGSR
jgi:hypothetical protein